MKVEDGNVQRAACS